MLLSELSNETPLAKETRRFSQLREEGIKQAEESERKIIKHEGKFNNIPALLRRADKLVIQYFHAQGKFTNIDSFKAFLTEKLETYRKYITASTLEEMEKWEGEGIEIQRCYHKIIFFGEFNPYIQHSENKKKSRSNTLTDAVEKQAVGILK